MSKLTQKLIDHFESLSWLEPDRYHFRFRQGEGEYWYGGLIYSPSSSQSGKVELLLGDDYIQASLMRPRADYPRDYYVTAFYKTDEMSEESLNEAWMIYKRLVEKYAPEPVYEFTSRITPK